MVDFSLTADFLPQALIAILPGFIGLGLLVYVWFKVARTYTTIFFLAFLASCTLWQLSEGFLRLSIHEEAAIFWNYVISLCVFPTLVFGLHFCLLFVKNKRFLLSTWFVGLIYVPGAFLWLMHILGFTVWGVTHSDRWNWHNDNLYAGFEILEVVWMSFTAILTMYFFLNYAFRCRNSDRIRKSRSRLMAIGYAAPALSGVIGQIFFPFVLRAEEIPLTTPMLIIFSITAIVALQKYQLLSFNPFYATDVVLDLMDEGVVIIDNQMRIRYANSGFVRLTGYKKSDVLDQHIGFLESSNDTGLEVNDLDLSGISEDSSQPEKIIASKLGEEIIVRLSYSKYFNRLGKEIGTIIVFTDITEIKRAGEKIQKEKLQALKYQNRLISSQLNPHFIFNSLNSVQYYILDEDIAPALDYISDFSRLMRSVLSNSLKDMITIADELHFLELYMKLELKRFKNKFDYEIEIDDEVDENELLIPPMLLQPYLENSIIHGLGAVTTGGKIYISFALDGDQVVCSIRDNGVGREKAEELKAMRVSANPHTSHAMNLTKTRIEVLNEISQSEHYVKINDLVDSNGNPAGTEVSVYFPQVEFV